MKRLAGKIALVTGGSRGIGRSVALRLAAEGAWVVVNYCRNREAAEATLAEIAGSGGQGELSPFDVADSSGVDAGVSGLLAKLGKIDILVNNAGVTHSGLLLRTKDADLERLLAVNVKGVFHCTRAVTAAMMKARYGRIVNLTSVVGETGNAGQAVYAASKAAIIGFTKAVARELAPRSITVNAVAPGFVATDMTVDLSEKLHAGILETIPLARMGTAEEIAEAVLFLALPQSGYITGHVLDVNGGMHM